jgi:hypothetical protein
MLERCEMLHPIHVAARRSATFNLVRVATV